MAKLSAGYHVGNKAVSHVPIRIAKPSSIWSVRTCSASSPSKYMKFWLLSGKYIRPGQAHLHPASDEAKS